MSKSTYRTYLEKLGNTDAEKFIGMKGDLFYDPEIRALKISDGVTAGGTSIVGGSGGGGSGSGVSGTMTGHVIPDTNAAYDLGNAEFKIRHLFLSDNSLWLGDDIKLEMMDGEPTFKIRNKGVVPDTIVSAGGTASAAQTLLGKPLENFTLKDWITYAITLDANLNSAGAIFPAGTAEFGEGKQWAELKGKNTGHEYKSAKKTMGHVNTLIAGPKKTLYDYNVKHVASSGTGGTTYDVAINASYFDQAFNNASVILLFYSASDISTMQDYLNNTVGPYGWFKMKFDDDNILQFQYQGGYSPSGTSFAAMTSLAASDVVAVQRVGGVNYNSAFDYDATATGWNNLFTTLRGINEGNLQLTRDENTFVDSYAPPRGIDHIVIEGWKPVTLTMVDPPVGDDYLYISFAGGMSPLTLDHDGLNLARLGGKAIIDVETGGVMQSRHECTFVADSFGFSAAFVNGMLGLNLDPTLGGAPALLTGWNGGWSADGTTKFNVAIPRDETSAIHDLQNLVRIPKMHSKGQYDGTGMLLDKRGDLRQLTDGSVAVCTQSFTQNNPGVTCWKKMALTDITPSP